MDMALANLFKLPFELVDEKSDYEELRRYSIGRQYSSKEIKSLKSVGALSSVDLSTNHLQSFYMYVLSAMIRECPFAISRAEIKSRVILDGDAAGQRDLIGYTLDNPRNNLHLFCRCAVAPVTDVIDNEWLKDETFHIYVEVYLYVSPEEFRKLETWKLLGFYLDL